MNDGPPIRVEPMAPDDLPAVLVLDRASGTNPWGHTAYAGEVLRGDAKGIYLVARQDTLAGSLPERGEHIVGFALGTAIYDELQVLSVAVRPDWRRQGIGELLIVAMIEAAKGLGLVQAALEVRVSNVAAQSLYAKLGFRAVGSRPHFYPDSGEDALVMTKLITVPG